jgi:hypothetical protein
MTPFRVLVAVGVAAILAGTSYALRPVEVDAGEPVAPARETVSDHLRAGAEGCSRGGGTWWQGTEGEVVVGRCRPFLDLGVGPAVAVRR